MEGSTKRVGSAPLVPLSGRERAGAGAGKRGLLRGLGRQAWPSLGSGPEDDKASATAAPCMAAAAGSLLARVSEQRTRGAGGDLTRRLLAAAAPQLAAPPPRSLAAARRCSEAQGQGTAGVVAQAGPTQRLLQRPWLLHACHGSSAVRGLRHCWPACRTARPTHLSSAEVEMEAAGAAPPAPAAAAARCSAATACGGTRLGCFQGCRRTCKPGEVAGRDTARWRATPARSQHEPAQRSTCIPYPPSHIAPALPPGCRSQGC